MSRVLVTGAGGFIGGHLVRRLLDGGHRVRAADVRPTDRWCRREPEAEARVLDLRDASACGEAVAGMDDVYNLASDMGGMGYIERNRARCMLSVLINTQLLDASRRAGAARYFFASSACVYAQDRQASTDVVALRESDAYPALPEDGYGWEKLFSERMCRHFSEDFGLVTRVARFHNVYGPFGTWRGGREKAPAAICRKVAEAAANGTGELEIWGDGEQRRSFTYIDDCVEGTRRIMESDVAEPLNLGSSEMVSVDGLADVVEEIAGTSLVRAYDASAPTGVRGRNSDNTLIRERLGWEPSTPLREGLEPTYRWVEAQVRAGAPALSDSSPTPGR